MTCSRIKSVPPFNCPNWMCEWCFIQAKKRWQTFYFVQLSYVQTKKLPMFYSDQLIFSNLKTRCVRICLEFCTIDIFTKFWRITHIRKCELTPRENLQKNCAKFLQLCGMWMQRYVILCKLVVSTILFLILFISFSYCGVYKLKHSFLFMTS